MQGYEKYNLKVLFGWRCEQVEDVIEAWPNYEDDLVAFWVMDGAVGFALGGVPPLLEKWADWFDFSIEEGKEFLNFPRILRPCYVQLRDERNRLRKMSE